MGSSAHIQVSEKPCLGVMGEQNKKEKVMDLLVITLGRPVGKKHGTFQGVAPYRASGKVMKRLEGECLGTQPGQMPPQDTSTCQGHSGATQTPICQLSLTSSSNQLWV